MKVTLHVGCLLASIMKKKTIIAVSVGIIIYVSLKYIKTPKTLHNTSASKYVQSKEQGRPSMFPPQCSWQCYLRQNQDLNNTLAWDETQATTHYLEYGFYEDRNCACRVVLLAGPHKTASSILESIALIFSGKMDNVQYHWVGGYNTMGIAPFIVKADNDDYRFTHLFGRPVSFENLKHEVVEESMRKYEEGYNLILASEEVDRITKPIGDGASNLIEKIVEIIPEKVTKHKNELLSVLVMYRAPRSAHLRSVWGEQQVSHSIYEKADPKSFKEWVCDSSTLRTSSLNQLKTNYHEVDSLGLANILVRKGMKVKLFDMTIESENIDLFSMLGCDVMGLHCIYDLEQSQIIPLAIVEHQNRQNILHQMTEQYNEGDKFKEMNELFDASQEQMAKIDDAMNMYDCVQFLEMEKYRGQLEVLYNPNMLKTNMTKCKEYSNFLNREELIRSIRETMGCSN